MSQIYLARILEPDGYGLFAIGWTILRLFSIAGHLGLDYGITKFGTKYLEKAQSRLKSLIIISSGSAFLSGLIFGILLNIYAPWIAESVFNKKDLEPILRGFAVIFPFATSIRVLSAASTLYGKTLYGAIFEDILQPIVQMIFFIILLRGVNSITAAVTSTVISYVVAAVIGVGLLSKLIPGIVSLKRILFQDFWPLLRFSIPAIIGATLGAFNIWGDRLVVGYFGTEFDTGIYQSISIITMLTTTLLSGMKISIAPIISQLHNNHRHFEIEHLLKSTSRWGLYLSMPLLLFVMINPKNIILFFFGENYLSGIVPLLILTIGQFIYVIIGTLDQSLLMTGNHKAWLVISAIVFTSTILLDAFIIPKYHLIGASLVSSSMTLFLGILSLLYVKLRLNYWILDISHVKVILAAIISGVIAAPFSSHLLYNDFLNFIISFILISLVFITLLFTFGIDPNDKNWLTKTIFTRRIQK